MNWEPLSLPRQAGQRHRIAHDWPANGKVFKAAAEILHSAALHSG